MFERYAESSRQTIHRAKWEATRLGSKEIGTEHILLGLIADRIIFDIAFPAGDNQRLRAEILCCLPQAESPTMPTDLPLSDESQRALTLASRQADILNSEHVENWHILLGLLGSEESAASQLMKRKGLSVENFRDRLPRDPISSSGYSSSPTPVGAESELANFIRKIIALTKVSKHEEALALLDDAMARTTDAWRIRPLGSLAIVISRSRGDFERTKSYCLKRLALDPEDPTTLYELADCLVQQGEMDLAKKYVAKIFESIMTKGCTLDKGLLEVLEKRFPDLRR